MPFILNTQIDLLDILALIISVIALAATLRKKEYGKFYLIPKNDTQKEVWVKLIKSDIYDVKIICEPYTGMSGRIDLLYPDAEKDSVWVFISELKPDFEFGSIKADTIIKFHNCKSTKFHVTFRDKYNNLYSQCISQDDIGRRYHKNIWNLTFVGT